MRIAMTLGLLGGLAGTAAAAYALYTVGGMAPYGDRLGFGIAALALALVAAGATMLVRARPAVASLVMAGASLAGLAAISLFDINTWYVLTVPLCLLAAVVALTARGAAGRVIGSSGLRVGLLLVIAAATALGYVFGGLYVAGALGAVLVIALILQFVRPTTVL
jgi:hypothetical protein